jgi:hypothetical protein
MLQQRCRGAPTTVRPSPQPEAKCRGVFPRTWKLNSRCLCRSTNRRQSRNVSCFIFRLSFPFYTSISETRPNRGSLQQQILSIPGLGDFIVGQRTLVLAGVDEERWTAIALIDGSSRRALTVDRDKHNSQELRKDPIAGTEYFSPNTSLKARLYFPWLWKAWIEEVRRRWAEVVGVIIDGIQE